MTGQLVEKHLCTTIMILVATVRLFCGQQATVTNDAMWVNDKVVVTRIVMAGRDEQSAKEQKREQYVFEVRREVKAAARSDGTGAWLITYAAATDNGQPSLVDNRSFLVDMVSGPHITDSSGSDVSGDVAELVQSDVSRWFPSIAREAPNCIAGVPEDLCRDLTGAVQWAAKGVKVTGRGDAIGEWRLNASTDQRRLSGTVKQDDGGIVVTLGDRSETDEVTGNANPAVLGAQNQKTETPTIKGVGYTRAEEVIIRTHKPTQR